LHGRYRVLTGRQKKTVVVVAALARELCGFVWAIACQVSAPQKVNLRAQTTAKPTKPIPRQTASVTEAPRTGATNKKDYQLVASKSFRR
jgi:hypothetical protein